MMLVDVFQSIGSITVIAMPCITLRCRIVILRLRKALSFALVIVGMNALIRLPVIVRDSK